MSPTNPSGEGELCARTWIEKWQHKRCKRKGVIERDGKHYCKQHDPVAVRARRDASYAKFQAECDESAKRRQRIVAMEAFCASFTTEELESGNFHIVRKAKP